MSTSEPIRSATISRWMSSTPSMRSPPSSTIRSSGTQAGGLRGAVGHHLKYLDAGCLSTLAPGARRQRARPAGDAEVGAPHPAVVHKVADHLARCIVDRHGEPEPHTRHGGVDSDELAARVDQRSAGVARVESGVGLNHVVDHPHRAPRPGRQRAPEGRDDAGRHRAGEAVWVADCDDELAYTQVRGLAERCWNQVVGVAAQHREVRQRVGARDTEADLAPVHERRPSQPVAAGHHVGGREQEAVGCQHDRAARARRDAAAPGGAKHAQIRDARSEPLDDVDDGPRVGVERRRFARTS